MPRWVWLAVAVGTYVIAVVVAPASLRAVTSDLGLVIGQFGTGLALWRKAKSRGAAGRTWRFAAASAISSSLIFVVWLFYDAAGDVVPVPSLADVPFFFAVALMIPAVLALPQIEATAWDRVRLGLDGLIIALSLLIISWHLVLGVTVAAGAATTLQRVVLVAYPLADVMALSTALLIATRIRVQSRVAVLWVGAGILALAVGDGIFGYLTLSGTWTVGHPATALWIVGYMLMLVGAHHQTRDTEQPRDLTRQTVTRVAALVVPVVVALVVGVFFDAGPGEAFATGTLVALVLARQTSALFSELHVRAALEQRVDAQTQELRRQAYHDPITELGNRALLRQRAAEIGAGMKDTALLLLDLDGFKEVNDSLGHASGDALLLQVGNRVGGSVRTCDTVVRLGGDEFAVLLPDTGVNAATTAADRIITALRAPFPLGGTAVSVRGSIGIALAGSAADLDLMLRNADLAMYEAKANGGDESCVFNRHMHDRVTSRMQLEGEVRDGVAAGQFTVYYQPIVDAATAEVRCLEALVRWHHPQRGVVPPVGFLQAAERTGVIVELGRFVLRTACEQVSRWRADWPELTVAVNLSHRELLDPGLPAAVAEILADTGLPADALHLEVTETVLAGEADINGVLERLADLGVRCSIDDFGTGHSSLSRLRELPVDRLKIDKSFMAEIAGDAAPLLSSIIALGHSLGRTVVAEGVETAEQFSFLVENGCDEIQGYYFSRPVPETHVVPLLFGMNVPKSTKLVLPADPFSPLVSQITNPDMPLEQPIRALLRELTALSGLDTTFFTTLTDDGTQQVTRYAENAGSIVVDEGLAVDWCDTLCRRMTEDNVAQCPEVSQRYGDVQVARDLGIETYVSIPIRHADGRVCGTLCGASSQSRIVDPAVVDLMQLFAQVLSERVDSVPASPSPEVLRSRHRRRPTTPWPP